MRGMSHQERLGRLGFSPGWAAYLPEEEAMEACARLADGQLTDPRGLRRRAQRRWIQEGPLDGEGLSVLLSLLAAEPDPDVQQDGLTQLARAPRLDAWRLELLKVHPLLATPALQAILQHASLLRGIQEPEPETAILQAALDSGDAALHTALLALSPVPTWVRTALVTQGATRALRQQARGEGAG